MKRGDKVSVVDEDLRGTITGVKGNRATVEDEHGFSYEFPVEKLVPVQKEIYSQNTVIQKDNSFKSKTNAFRTDIDLHITRLHPRPNSLSAEERLYLQREHLAKEIQRLRAAGIKKIEVIHGLGDGVVQQMVYDYLNGRTGLDFHDKEILQEQSAAVVVYLR